MNEKILKLFTQACHHSDYEQELVTNDVVEKFAELMVQEFIDVVENLAPMYDDYRDQIEDRFRRDCISQVKHRFIWSDKE
jgi:hypothetical protein